MLQVAYIRAHKEEVIERLAVKNFDAKEIIEELIVLDERRRNTQSENDAILAESNKLSKEIGELFKSGNVEQANAKKTETALLKEKTKVLQQVLSETQESLERKLVFLKVPAVKLKFFL